MKTVYWIEGDGIGPDIWRGARLVLDAALSKTGRSLNWQELLAGEKALAATGELLPTSTLETLAKAELAIKGPLNTPVGTGFRSLTVTMRQVLDLYACIRPIRYFPGVSSPLRHPERVNMVVFRENTEDVYAGLEYEAKSKEALALIDFLQDKFQVSLSPETAIGLKPMTESGSKRLIRSAIKYALAHKLPSVTLVHKGNIMKYTEGAFRKHGYDLAAAEFSDSVSPEGSPAKAVVLKDRIADAMFQEALLRPEQYSVLAAPNLNGDYLSDAIAAQVGGLGLAPGVNMSDKLAFFEATHGTAPSLAGKDKANPTSLILSAGLMFEHLGWLDTAKLMESAILRVLVQGQVTEDLSSQMENPLPAIGCMAFAEAVVKEMDSSLYTLP